MTRKKKLLWLLRAMVVPIVAGMLVVYAGIELNIVALIVVGAVAIVGGIAGLAFAATASRRPPKKLLKRWGAYISLKEQKITDYAAELDKIAENYRADPDKNKNRFEKPHVSDIDSFCDFSVLQTGDIYYGYFVRADGMLFTPSADVDEAMTAMLLYSRDPFFKSDPEQLSGIADVLIENREHNMLRYESLYHFNERLSDELTGGREVFLTDVLVCRKHVPVGMLGGLRIIPVIASPDRSKSCFIVDCKYWTNKFVHAYFTTGSNDGPPDTYGDPFEDNA